MQSQWLDHINKLAGLYKIDSNLIKAICFVESGWVPGRSRFERGWKYFYKPHTMSKRLGITFDTEQIGQMHSYGLMQVMGAVFREHGYTGYFTEITWAIGLDYGVKHLAHFFSRHQGDRIKAIASYNAGNPKYVDGSLINQSYVDEVLKQLNIYEKGN